MNLNEILDLRKNETFTIIKNVKKVFKDLDEGIFHTKPTSESWIFSECFAQLNLTLNHYIPQTVKIAYQKDKYSKWTVSLIHSIMGKLFVKSMAPIHDQRIPFKTKTFAKLKPGFSKGNQHDILHEFLGFQENLLDLCKNLTFMSLKKPNIVTFTGPQAKMNIGDGLHLMVAHNQRHLLRA